MKNFLAIFFLFLSITYSQIGSIYSNTPIGEVITDISVRRNGLGLAIASQETYDLNPLNPASWSYIPYVKFIGSFKFTSNSYADHNGKNKLSSGSFNSLIVSFPVERNFGIVFSGGILPYSKINYKVLGPDNYFDSIKHKTQFEANGGLTNYYFGLSGRIKDYFSFGSTANFIVGTVSKVLSTDFQEENLTDPEFTEQFKYNGAGFRIGLISENLNRYLRVNFINDIRVGFTYSNKINLNTNHIELKSGFLIDTVSESNFKTKIPSQLAFGVALRVKERFNLYADFLSQDLSKLETQFKTDSYELSSQNIYSFGVELLPKIKPENFFESITWRFGFFQKNLGVKINHQTINEIGVRAGFSFPIDQFNLVDIAAQYSVRGKSEKPYVKENIFNLWIGINFAEIWFIRPED